MAAYIEPSPSKSPSGTTNSREGQAGSSFSMRPVNIAASFNMGRWSTTASRAACPTNALIGIGRRCSSPMVYSSRPTTAPTCGSWLKSHRTACPTTLGIGSTRQSSDGSRSTSELVGAPDVTKETRFRRPRNPAGTWPAQNAGHRRCVVSPSRVPLCPNASRGACRCCAFSYWSFPKSITKCTITHF